jgi:peptidylprolyl isomerase
MFADSLPRLFSRGRMVAVAATAVVMLIAACGDDDSGGNVVADALKDNDLPTQPGAPTTEPQTCESGDKELTEDDKPEVTVPEGDPPKELEIEDITEGKGHEVATGDSVEVQYTGVAYSTKEEFDTSWDDMTPLPVTVGEGGVIQGWDQGLVGMKAGGRRQLIIPPDLAYGEKGQEPDIGPNETLVFVVDAVEVCFAEGGPDTTTTASTTAPEGEGSSTTASTTAPEGDGTTASSTSEPETTTTDAE